MVFWSIYNKPVVPDIFSRERTDPGRADAPHMGEREKELVRVSGVAFGVKNIAFLQQKLRWMHS